MVNNIKKAIRYYETRVQVNDIAIEMKEKEGVINLKLNHIINQCPG